MEKFYQACFSRLGSNSRNAGWQLTNTSPDIPYRILDVFESRQKSNEPVNRATPTDSQGRPLCAMEINCESDFISFTKIQYGVPCYGREGMYCHGYFYGNAYEMLKDPNRLLTISDENFCFRQDDELSTGSDFAAESMQDTSSGILEQYLARTEQIPSELAFDEPFDEDSALQICGMNKERYVLFIHCLFAAWGKNAKTTIFVQTDGSDRMTKAMLYLAYSAIPYSLRPKLVASTFVDARNATLVFTNETLGSCWYFNPETGENNILNNAQRKRWNNTPIATNYAANYGKLATEKESYFGRIESELKVLGDIYSQDLNLLQLAYKMAFDSGDTDADLVGTMYDWLNLPLNYNDYLESKLAGILKKVIEADCQLGPDLVQMLNQRLSAATNRELIKLGYRYQSMQLAKKSVEEGCAYLQTLIPESPIFNAIREDLSRKPVGRKMLCAFYMNQATTLKDDKECTYQTLSDFVQTFSDLPQMDQVWKVVIEKGYSIASKKLIERLSDRRDYGEERLPDVSWFTSLVGEFEEFMKETVSFSMNRPLEQYTHSCVDAMKKRYDKYFRQDFRAEKFCEYQQFYQIYGHEPSMRYSAELVRMYERAEQGEFGWISNFVAGGCFVRNEGPADMKERQAIVYSLLSFCEKNGVAEKCQDFVFWSEMASAMKKSVVQFMIERKARLFCDPNCLSASLQMDTVYWSDDNLSEIRNLYQAYVDRYEDNPCKKSKELLDAEAKRRAEEAKRKARQQKNEEKQRRQEEERQRHLEEKQRRQQRSFFGSAGSPIWDRVNNTHDTDLDEKYDQSTDLYGTYIQGVGTSRAYDQDIENFNNYDQKSASVASRTQQRLTEEHTHPATKGVEHGKKAEKNNTAPTVQNATVDNNYGEWAYGSNTDMNMEYDRVTQPSGTKAKDTGGLLSGIRSMFRRRKDGD